jgi:hypothetical protein
VLLESPKEEKNMALKTRYQKDLFLDITPWENRLPEAERERLKALLGELIVSVFEAEEQASERREVDDD